MGITRHNSVLSALEKRALRYRNKGQQQDYDAQLYQDAIDETGTVSTANLTDSDDDSITSEEGNYIKTAEQLERMEIREVDHELLKIHGVAPGKKAEGVTRMGYENPDGFNTIIKDNDKLEKAKEIIDELELDVMAYSEHRINSRHKQNKNGMSQMFRGGEAEIRTITGHNVHENVGRVQQGGVSMLLYGSLIQQYDFEHSGKDDTGLGRWVSMRLVGEGDIVTRMVVCYNPCYNKTGSKSTYQQHRRYFAQKEKDTTCPRKRFRQDLKKQLNTWREQGERLIVCMDANENIYKKALAKCLRTETGWL